MPVKIVDVYFLRSIFDGNRIVRKVQIEICSNELGILHVRWCVQRNVRIGIRQLRGVIRKAKECYNEKKKTKQRKED